MKLRQFEKFERWYSRHYWSIFGMSECWFNKVDVRPSAVIEYEKEEVQALWESWEASRRSNVK